MSEETINPALEPLVRDIEGLTEDPQNAPRTRDVALRWTDTANCLARRAEYVARASAYREGGGAGEDVFATFVSEDAGRAVGVGRAVGYHVSSEEDRSQWQDVVGTDREVMAQLEEGAFGTEKGRARLWAERFRPGEVIITSDGGLSFPEA